MAKKEAELILKGVTLEPIREQWELRLRNWFLGHGCVYDEVTGDIVESDGVRVPRKKWLKVVKQIKEGTHKFKADREKNLLTLVLGNPEKGGRTRGLGPNFPWWIGFPEDKDSYRSRERAKKRWEEQEDDRFSELRRIIEHPQYQIDEIRGVRQPAFDIAASSSQRKSSVVDSQVPADDA